MIIDSGQFFLSQLGYSMTIPLQIYDQIQQLRREITEIASADQDRRASGPEKVKHEKRIQRLEEIRSQLSALIWTHGCGRRF